MSQPQTITPIAREALVARVGACQAEGFRLVQICATQLAEGFELTYSFDRAGVLESLRIAVPAADRQAPSITGVYFAAFTYENEIHDLFGISFPGLALDFKGAFYRTAIPAPFAKPPAPAAAAAPAAPSTPATP